MVAETQFLVTPLSEYGGKPITPGEAQEIHKGPSQAQKKGKPNPVCYVDVREEIGMCMKFYQWDLSVFSLGLEPLGTGIH